MKNIFLSLLILFICKQSFATASAIREEKVKINFKSSPYPKEQKSFYFTFQNFLITGYENSDWLKEPTGWKTVKSSELNNLGIKEGDIIQYIDFKTGEKKEYTLKEKVNIALIGNDFYEENDPKRLPNRTFYILLQDSIEGVKHPGGLNGDNLSGIAYVGAKLKLKTSKPIKPTFEEISKDDDTIRRIMDAYHKDKSGFREGKPFNLKKVSFANINKMQMYKFEGGHEEYLNGVGLVIKTGVNDFLNLSDYWADTDYSPAKGEFDYFDFIEEYDFALLIKDSGMHSCYRLNLYKNGVETSYTINCDSGGC